MRVTFIHNPDSGGSSQRTADQLMALIRKAGHHPRYQSSKDKDWHTVLEEPADLVAVAGGDGTVAKVAKRLLRRGIPIAILPLGTANNIFKMLHLTSTVEELIAGWAQGRRLNVDIGTATGPWGPKCFLEGLGIGLLADIMFGADVDSAAPSANLQATPAAILKLSAERLRDYPARRLKVTLDGRDLSGDYVLFEAMNIRFIGPNLDLAPEAEPNDGLLDVVLLQEGEREQLATYFANQLKSSYEPARLTVYKGHDLQIEWQGLDIHIDDELWPDNDTALSSPPTIINAKAEANALEFLVPA
jgi:diacylglycerol kinase (ATP)